MSTKPVGVRGASTNPVGSRTSSGKPAAPKPGGASPKGADLEAQLGRCQTLPSLPGVAVWLLDLCRESEPDIAAVADTLGKDPALTAKVLRMVNSPAYGIRGEVKNIHHAILLLGLITVRTVALSFSLAQGLKKAQKTALKTYWKRSVFAATAARELARRLGRADREEAFLAGLLQDIGVLALAQVTGRKYANLAPDRIDDHSAAMTHELNEFGVDHAVAGSWLAKHWKLPSSFVMTIRYSHDPTACKEPDSEALQLVQIVAVAGSIADVWVHPGTALATQIAREASRDWLGIDGEAFNDVLAMVGKSVTEVAELLDAEVGSASDVQSVLEQAREALFMVSVSATQEVQFAKREADTLAARTKVLEEENAKDALTGVGNRGALERRLALDLGYAMETRQNLSILIVDLDHFKRFNDDHGHQTGDRVLVETARALKGGVRPRDFVGRYGGEEFVVVRPDTPPAGAMVVAERLRSRIEEQQLTSVAGTPLRVTGSIGVATLDPATPETVADLVARADKALYSAKSSGRNRVVYASFLVAPAG